MFEGVLSLVCYPSLLFFSLSALLFVLILPLTLHNCCLCWYCVCNVCHSNFVCENIQCVYIDSIYIYIYIYIYMQDLCKDTLPNARKTEMSGKNDGLCYPSNSFLIT